MKLLCRRWSATLITGSPSQNEEPTVESILDFNKQEMDSLKNNVNFGRIAMNLQEEQKYQPYREHKKPEETSDGKEVFARPAIEPRRAEPKVEKDKCLKAYLLKLYRKTVNLQEAENILTPSKPKNRNRHAPILLMSSSSTLQTTPI